MCLLIQSRFFGMQGWQVCSAVNYLIAFRSWDKWPETENDWLTIEPCYGLCDISNNLIAKLIINQSADGVILRDNDL